MASAADQHVSAAHLPPEVERRGWRKAMFGRFVIAVAAMVVATKFGTSYFHLCSAGYKTIEYFACFGSPLVCGALILFIRRYLIALPLIAGWLLLLKLCAEPYLSWIHA